MARNAIESEFRTSKMADVSHFSKTNLKLHIDVKWIEIEIESDFRISKMATGSHFVKKNQKKEKSVLI